MYRRTLENFPGVCQESMNFPNGRRPVSSRVRALKKPVAVEVNGGGNGLISMEVPLDLWEGI